jgi:hypothetical protein
MQVFGAHTNISINIEHTIHNATTQVLVVSLSDLSALAVAVDNVKASGSGPRNEVSNSSGMNSTKMFSLKASDKTVSMSVWTFEIGTPMEVTSSLVFNISHPCA